MIFNSFEIDEIKLEFYILQCDPIYLSIIYGLDVKDCGVSFGNPTLVEMSASLMKAYQGNLASDKMITKLITL